MSVSLVRGVEAVVRRSNQWLLPLLLLHCIALCYLLVADFCVGSKGSNSPRASPRLASPRLTLANANDAARHA